MKKTISLFLAAALLLSLSACRKGGSAGSDLSDEWEYIYSSEIIEVEGNNDDNSSTGSSGGTSSSDKVSTGKPREPKDELVVEGAGKDPDAKYDVSGTVTVAVSSYRPADYEAMFDAFSAVYPNIEIIIDYRPKSGADSDECSAYLASRALAGNMPDVVFDDAGMLPSYITQGWVYPLDEFVKGDSNFSNVPESLIDDYTYGGKLYALPHQAHFGAVVINTDALDELNLKKPSLSWNMDDLEKLLKAGTTDRFSGCEYLGEVAYNFAGSFNKNASLFGYVIDTHKFDTSAYMSAVKMVNELRNYPGLEAYQLRFSNSSAGVSDYVSKFGNGNTDVVDMAFKLGRTVVHFDQGTWSVDNLKSICKFGYELYPYPQAEPGCIPIHVDHCFMISSTKNPEAAFQVLRYMTYSTEGNLARLSMYDSNNKGKYALNNRLYYPTTLNSEVMAKFKSLPEVNDVDIYFYENIGNGFRQDPVKIVPGWNEIMKTLTSTVDGKDEADIDSWIASFEKKANETAAEKWADFDKKLKTVQASFGK